MTRRRIAVVTADVLSERMAGPAIRALHLAEELSAAHDLRLISTAECSLAQDRFSCAFVSWSGLAEALADVEIVIVQGFVTYHAPWLIRSDKILVVDLYDPIHLEQLEQLRDAGPVERRATMDVTVRVLNEQLVRGDFFLCASEEQRHLWLGHLGAMGRLSPENYARDPTLQRLIAICPFGISPQPPRSTAPAIRGVIDGIGAQDRVVLWAGGVYNWFDPITLIRAVAKVSVDHPDVRLLFLGMRHPNPDVPAMRVGWQARQLADELALTGKHVFFNEGWVPYTERQNYLTEADLGVSTHVEHVETTFSFRTRILDYLWANLPIVTTRGDTFGRLVAAERLGVTVPAGDVDALADALIRTLYDLTFVAECRAQVSLVRQRFTWPRAVRPLVDFCADAERAPDAGADQWRFARRAVPPQGRIARDVLRARSVLAQGGPRLAVQRLLARGRRLRREHRP